MFFCAVVALANNISRPDDCSCTESIAIIHLVASVSCVELVTWLREDERSICLEASAAFAHFLATIDTTRRESHIAV
jgi:hypothetical protein